MAVSSVATNSHLAGGVYRARTYDLHDVNVALWPAELRPQARNIVYLSPLQLSTLKFTFFRIFLNPPHNMDNVSRIVSDRPDRLHSHFVSGIIHTV